MTDFEKVSLLIFHDIIQTSGTSERELRAGMEDMEDMAQTILCGYDKILYGDKNETT